MWRLVTPVFLSIGFNQFFINNFLLLLMGSMVESYGMGPGRLAILYFVSTIGGYTFGSGVNHAASVGCGPAIYGMVACLFCNIVVNWRALDKIEGTGKFCLIFFVIALLAMTILMTYQKALYPWFDKSDIASNMGGLMAGLCISLALITPARAAATRAGSFEKKVAIVGYVLTGVYFLLNFLCFFLVSDPK